MKAFSELVAAHEDSRRPSSLLGVTSPFGAAERIELAEVEYLSMLDENLLNPLMESALKVNDPRARVLKIQLAHAVRWFHQNLPEMEISASNNHFNSGGEKGLVSPERMKQFETFTNSIIKLIREDSQLEKSLGIWPTTK